MPQTRAPIHARAHSGACTHTYVQPRCDTRPRVRAHRTVACARSPSRTPLAICACISAAPWNARGARRSGSVRLKIARAAFEAFLLTAVHRQPLSGRACCARNKNKTDVSGFGLAALKTGACTHLRPPCRRPSQWQSELRCRPVLAVSAVRVRRSSCRRLLTVLQATVGFRDTNRYACRAEPLMRPISPPRLRFHRFN